MFAYLPHHHVCIPSMRHVRSSLYIHTSTHPHSTHPHTIHTLTYTHPHSTPSHLHTLTLHPHTIHTHIYTPSLYTSSHFTHPHIYTPSHLHTLTLHNVPTHLHTHTSTYPQPSHIHVAAEFISKLAAVEEQHAQQLNNVVKNFRRRTNETLRRESWVTGVEEWVGVVEECVWNEPCSRMWPTLSVVNYVGSLKEPKHIVCNDQKPYSPEDQCFWAYSSNTI